MPSFTYEELTLMCIYNPGSRSGLIAELLDMRGYLGPDEPELRTLTNSVLSKLEAMSDTDFESMNLPCD